MTMPPKSASPTEEQHDGNLFAVVVLLLTGAAIGSLWTLALTWWLS